MDNESFFKMPKVLFTDKYNGLSAEAKLLYGLMLDRMQLSAINCWCDKNGEVFIFYTIAETSEMLGCGHDKATRLQRELEKHNLLRRKYQGKEKRTSNAAVLDVTGRDQEDQRLHLNKNPETLVWELESVETELWQEPPDPFLESIAAFLSSAGERWEGTASELCSLLNLDCKPNVLSLRLSIGSVRLLRDHDIHYKASRNHGGRKISLWKKMDSVSKGDDRDGLLVGSGEA